MIYGGKRSGTPDCVSFFSLNVIVVIVALIVVVVVVVVVVVG